MKIQSLIFSVGAVALLSLTGCGVEESSGADGRTSKVESVSKLNESNYLNLAKYYYLQETRSRNIMKSRSMQHIKSVEDKNAIYVKSNRDSSNTITSMIIKNRNALVSVSIDLESQSVSVTLHGGESEATQTLTMDQFRNFDVDTTMTNEGEA